MDDVKNILGFISRFTQKGKRKEVEECFLSGCCYWFAEILKIRFNGNIVYDSINNHFATRINNRVYDITGDVTDKFDAPWTIWELYEFESNHRSNIERECINFVK